MLLKDKATLVTGTATGLGRIGFCHQPNYEADGKLSSKDEQTQNSNNREVLDMVYRIVATVAVLALIGGSGLAQQICDQSALDSLDGVRAEHSGDISVLFAAIDDIKTEWQTCTSGDGSAQVDEQSAEETQMSASEIVAEGHIIEGLWQFTTETTNSDTCGERKKKYTNQFFEDVYYNDDGLLVWDGGNVYSNFTFEYLLATRYTKSDSNNWVSEREIAAATETTMSGRWDGYWQGNKDFWCTSYGTFIAELFDTQNACLVEGKANIRSSPSTRSPKNGAIDGQRRVVAKVPGDDGYSWWKVSDNEYVREDVVEASRSCDRL